MKNYYIWLWLSAFIMAGCDSKVEQQVEESTVKYNYPALNESPLPPAPPAERTSGRAASENMNSETGQPRALIRENVGLKAELRKMEQIKKLREYADKAGTNDPFAMTEQEIEEFSKLDNPIVN